MKGNAEVVAAVRELLVTEADDGLSLSSTVPEPWLGQGWELHEDAISKTYTFKNHYQAVAFANAVAWISHREDHHPDMAVGYNTVRVGYTTHAIHGLSVNDFICAAKVDALFDL